MRFSIATTFSMAALAIALIGCEPTAEETARLPKSAGTKVKPPAHDDHDHDHGHAAEGPHHGKIIELGKAEYHAEFVHDDKSLTIYILDGTAKKASAIEASELVINLLHDGKPEQFKVAAKRDEGDAEGKSSRFVSEDPELVGHIDESSAAPKLVLVNGGVTYRGAIPTNHEHGDHDHDAHGHDDHGHDH